MSNIVKVFSGSYMLQGDSGDNGENGTGVSDIRGSIVDNPAFSALYTNKESKAGNLVWLRSGEALVEDRYGDFQFVSGDDITNYIENSNDFSLWADPLTKWTLTSTGQPDPLGGNNASHITLDANITSGTAFMESIADGMTSGEYHTASFYFKVISGTVTALEVKVGSILFTVNADLDSNWQLVNVSTDVSASSALITIIPVGSSGAVIGMFATQFENGSIVHDRITTLLVPVTVSNPLSAARQNDLGYLIEDQKQNLITNSENLTLSNWSISGGNVSQFSGAGVFGDYFQNIQVNFTNANVFLESTGTFVNGTEYTVSFFVKLNTGSLEQIAVSIANGDTANFTEFSSSGFTRLSAKLTAGVSGNLKFNLISANLTAQPLIMGVQVEEGDLTSYIRNGNAISTRPEDDVNATYNLPRPDEAWSCLFYHDAIPNNANDKYIFNNGLSAGDEFSCNITSDNLTLNIGGVLSVFTTVLDSANIVLVFDGTNIKLYKDGFLFETIANAGAVSAIATNIYLGSDETAANSINAYLSRVNFWDIELNSDEVRYIAGV